MDPARVGPIRCVEDLEQHAGERSGEEQHGRRGNLDVGGIVDLDVIILDGVDDQAVELLVGHRLAVYVNQWGMPASTRLETRDPLYARSISLVSAMGDLLRGPGN